MKTDTPDIDNIIKNLFAHQQETVDALEFSVFRLRGLQEYFMERSSSDSPAVFSDRRLSVIFGRAADALQRAIDAPGSTHGLDEDERALMAAGAAESAMSRTDREAAERHAYAGIDAFIESDPARWQNLRRVCPDEVAHAGRALGRRL